MKNLTVFYELPGNIKFNRSPLIFARSSSNSIWLLYNTIDIQMNCELKRQRSSVYHYHIRWRHHI